ncbi:MAG: peptidoglycan DD-metalloendopeptidase family protein [Clostridia bacterium]|nr:peptidoglycan DD-metalloendopeptidase family protein [Clostridia bacterium]
MEKKHATNGKLRTFLKKNVYYIILAICLIAIAAMIAVTVITRSNTSADVTPAGPTDNVDPVDVEPGEPSDPGKTDEPTQPSEPEKPVAIVFASPVRDANVQKDYAMDSLVWHKTLRQYSVHDGIDFAGNDGDSVLAVYGGTVTAVDYDVLNGYVVKIKHNDRLTSSYACLNEPTVVVGQTVQKGEAIGTMGLTSGKEYLEGAHVHFSLLKDGEISDPYEYLSLGDK